MGKKEKKREKAENTEAVENGGPESNEKRSKKKRKNADKVQEEQTNDVPSTAEIPTITIALPGSIVDNTQSLELATRLAGQVARAATIFRIDEVVIFDNKSTLEDASAEIMEKDVGDNETGIAREKLYQGSAVTLVDVGLSKVDQVLEPGTRVTVEMGTNRNLDAGPRKIVPSSRPRDEGIYWGYRLREDMIIASVPLNTDQLLVLLSLLYRHSSTF